ncbi:sensor histidine kinase [Micromonospora sp. DT233]|uniref:sensor histidine kinase n=1 Tax=Micromonospora sp. DT233 TaxID=3393432 RepID=UPI003CEA9B43
MRVQTRRVTLVDAGSALVAVAGCVLLGVAGLAGWQWSAAMAALLAIRRAAPVAMLVLVAVVSGVHVLLSQSFMFPGDLVSLVAVHAVAAHAPGRLRHAGLLLGAAGAVLVVGHALHEHRPGAALPAVLIVATALAAWSTGLMQRQQRIAVRHAEHRRRLAELDSATRAQLAVHEERTRISQEMHDIIAHSLASIIAQAEGGRVAARADALVAGPLFDRIAGIGREALSDVKRLLTVVDHDAHDRHAKGLRELPELLASVAAAGLDVTTSVEGRAHSLAPGMDLAVYRVIQECLTNVLKHSPRPQAQLHMGWTSTLLTVSVTSPAAERHPMVEGRGLSGIRQRCALFTGECAVTGDAGLFTVTTTWPLAPQGAAS